MTFWCDYGLDDIGDNGAAGALSNLWAVLVMAGSSAATERSVPFVAGYADLQEYDDASYARINLTGVTFALNLTTHRKELVCDPVPWPLLAAASANCIGMLIIHKITSDADSIPWGFYNGSPAFPFNGIGDNVQLTPPPGGFLRLGN